MASSNPIILAGISLLLLLLLLLHPFREVDATIPLPPIKYGFNVTGAICCAPLGLCGVDVPGFPDIIPKPRPIAGNPTSLTCEKSGTVESMGQTTTNSDGTFNFLIEASGVDGVDIPLIGGAPCNVTVEDTKCVFFLNNKVKAPVTVLFVDIMKLNKIAIAKPFFIARD